MYSELSDSELVSRLSLASSDEKREIFLALYERYKQLVLKVCYRHLADYDLAKDIFHDVFIKVIERLEAIQNPAYFKSWLMTITRNLCVDYLRKTSYIKKTVTPMTAEIEVVTGERTEDRIIAEMDRQRILTQLSVCIRSLDGFHLKVFRLRWQGLKAKHVLEIVKTDKVHLRRSYDKIKRTLESCMEGKGWKISIDQIISLGEIDE